MNYSNINSLYLEADCTSISKAQWDEYMKNARKANKREINRVVKKHIPELYESLALQFRNPYDYYRTSTHLILVHSMIEYFIKYE